MIALIFTCISLTVQLWNSGVLRKSICIARIWAGHKEISSYTLCKQGRTSMLTTIHSVNGYLLRFVSPFFLIRHITVYNHHCAPWQHSQANYLTLSESETNGEVEEVKRFFLWSTKNKHRKQCREEEKGADWVYANFFLSQIDNAF